MKKLKKLTALLLVAALVVAASAFTALAADVAFGAGTVDASCLNIRSGPGTDNSVISQVRRDEIVVILDKTSDTWYHINYNGVDGYVACRYLKEIVTRENFAAIGEVTDDEVRMRAQPNTSCDTYGYYDTGTRMTVIGINTGWYKVRYDGHTGYMRSDYMKIVSSYIPESATKPDNTVEPTPGGDENTDDTLGRQIADYAKQFVGYDYVYGGASPSTGFDCSGLVYYVYGQFGYSLSRGATSQYNNNGYSVDWSDMQPGDLMFFANPNYGEGITHVGIYIGGGEMVHASDYGVGVIVSDITTNHYRNTFYAAKRIV